MEIEVKSKYKLMRTCVNEVSLDLEGLENTIKYDKEWYAKKGTKYDENKLEDSIIDYVKELNVEELVDSDDFDDFDFDFIDFDDREITNLDELVEYFKYMIDEDTEI